MRSYWRQLALIALFCCMSVPFAYGAEAEKLVLNFAVEPQGVDPNLIYGPLLRYLGEQTGTTVVLNILKDDQEIIEHLLNGGVQIAHFSSALYGEALRRRLPIRYLVTVSDSTSPNPDFYRGVIISQKKSGLHNMADLKGKSLMFTSEDSTSGYKYPLAMLLAAGVVPHRDCSTVFFGGEHEAVTKAVADGMVEAGATWDGNYHKAVKTYGDIFTILAQSEPIPSEPFVAGPSVPDALVSRLQELLLAVNRQTLGKDGLPVISQLFVDELEIDSFSQHGPEFYQVVIDMQKILESHNGTGK